VAAVCAGVLALGIYGLGGTAVASKAKPTVSTGKVSGVGTVLVDSKGKTLYTLTNGGQAVPCTGDCAAAWPPLLVAAGATPKAGKGVTGLGVVSGGRQVTQSSLPLYRYSGDSKAHQANGEGISSFGGTWHVVKTSGSTPTGTKSSSSGGSYGY